MTSFCLGALFEIGPAAANGDENFHGWVLQSFMTVSINVTKRYTVWTKVFGQTSLGLNPGVSLSPIAKGV